jgi:hypothetical protein
MTRFGCSIDVKEREEMLRPPMDVVRSAARLPFKALAASGTLERNSGFGARPPAAPPEWGLC